MKAAKLFDLTGRVALVTGASSGLGAHFARLLAANGAKVALAARRVDRLTALAEEIAGAGGRALPVACDVTNQDSVEAAVLAVYRQDPQVLAARDRGAEEIAEDRGHRSAGDAVLEAFFLGNANQVVRRVVGVREELAKAGEVGAGGGVHSIRNDSAHDHQLSLLRPGQPRS